MNLKSARSAVGKQNSIYPSIIVFHVIQQLTFTAKKCHASTRVFTDTKNDVSFIEDAKNAWNGRV